MFIQKEVYAKLRWDAIHTNTTKDLSKFKPFLSTQIKGEISGWQLWN